MTRKSYVFEVGGEHAGDLRVRVAVAADQTLAALQREIANEFGLDPEADHAFYLSGLKLDPRSEYGACESEAERRADEAQVGRLALRVGSFVRHVGGGEQHRWHSVRVVAIEESDDERALPCIVERSGSREPTPEQLEQERALERWESEFEVLAHELAARAGEADEREVDEDWLRSEYELATRVLTWAKVDAAGLHDLESASEVEIIEWVLDLPGQLAGFGLEDEAAALCALAAEVTAPQLFLPERALLLARSGRLDEACEQADAALARFGDDDWVKAQIAEALLVCDDSARAEKLFREVYSSSRSPALVADAGGRLAELLEAGGRRDEATALDAERFERAESLALTPEGALDDAVEAELELEPQAKVGRNDACPCGSEKKFKRCCGARTAEVVTEARLCAELSDDVVRFSMRESEWNAAGDGLALFGGEEFRGLSISEALPLLCGDSIEDFFTQWWLFDHRWPDGATIGERFAARYRGRGDAREAEVLQRLCDSNVELVRVERIGANGRVLLRDVLDVAAPARVANSMQDGLTLGTTLAARVIELDGTPCVLPGVVEFATADVPRAVAAVRSARASEADEWSRILKRCAHVFHRLARDLTLKA